MNIDYVMTCYQHDYTRHAVAKTAGCVCFGIKFSKYGFLICAVSFVFHYCLKQVWYNGVNAK